MVARFATDLARRLLTWALASVLVGVVLLVTGDDFWRGFGLQAALWGLIDALIALVALRSARGDSAPGEVDQATRIRRILWLNAGLDLAYIAIGAGLVAIARDANPFLAGNGWGIAVQGGFLLVFDVVHAMRVPTPGPAARA